MQGYYAAVTKLLTAAGFAYWKPAKGSHEKWMNAETGRIIILPRNLKSRHTANAILKSAGCNERL